MWMTECTTCATGQSGGVEVWIRHLADQHVIPTEWTSNRAARLVGIAAQKPYTTTTESKKKRRRGTVPRPLNSFMLFAQHIRRNVLRVFGKASNSVISRQLGEAWRLLPRAVKNQYDEEAVRLAKIHQIEFPDYKYQPKKKSTLPMHSNTNTNALTTNSFLVNRSSETHRKRASTVVNTNHAGVDKVHVKNIQYATSAPSCVERGNFYDQTCGWYHSGSPVSIVDSSPQRAEDSAYYSSTSCSSSPMMTTGFPSPNKFVAGTQQQQMRMFSCQTPAGQGSHARQRYLSSTNQSPENLRSTGAMPYSFSSPVQLQSSTSVAQQYSVVHPAQPDVGMLPWSQRTNQVTSTSPSCLNPMQSDGRTPCVYNAAPAMLHTHEEFEQPRLEMLDETFGELFSSTEFENCSTDRSFVCSDSPFRSYVLGASGHTHSNWCHENRENHTSASPDFSLLTLPDFDIQSAAMSNELSPDLQCIDKSKLLYTKSEWPLFA